jgi:hypothetical protein
MHMIAVSVPPSATLLTVSQIEPSGQPAVVPDVVQLAVQYPPDIIVKQYSPPEHPVDIPLHIPPTDPIMVDLSHPTIAPNKTAKTIHLIVLLRPFF